MSESSGDPPPSHPVPDSDPLPANDAPSDIRPAPLPPAPRANPPTIFNQKDASAPPQVAMPAGFSEFVSWMQSFSAAPPPTAPPSPAEGRARLPKEQKKFHRHDPSASESAHESEASDPTGKRSLPLPAPGPVPTVRRRRAKPVVADDEPTFQIPWRLLLLIGVLAGCFVLGRKSAYVAAQNAAPPLTRATPDPGEAGRVIEGLFDEAMAAESAGDFRQATSLLQQAQQRGSRTVGINYQLALLAFESGDFPRAMSLLDHSLDAGEVPAACYHLRGLLNNRTGGINRGLGDLETATRLDPFNARYFFALGEALRRSGKPQAALACLLHAKDRLNESELSSVYGLKIRLTQIELGQDNEFAAQLADELQRRPPAVDWLFTAAALEMHRGRFAEAAGYLDKITALADARTVNSRLRDYFFYAFADTEPVSRFYAGLRRAEAAGAVPRPSASVTPSPAVSAPEPMASFPPPSSPPQP